MWQKYRSTKANQMPPVTMVIDSYHSRKFQVLRIVIKPLWSILSYMIKIIYKVNKLMHF